MALNLTKKQREELEKTLAAAEPYPEDAEELHTLDGAWGEGHAARWNATMAKRFLEQDNREKQKLMDFAK